LVKADGTFLESIEIFSCKKRFKKGLKDIVERYLPKEDDEKKERILFVVSHSSGIKPMLKLFNGDETKINGKTCGYCCSMGVEIERLADGKWESGELDVI
jgi:hypothetical protein